MSRERPARRGGKCVRHTIAVAVAVTLGACATRVPQVLTPQMVPAAFSGQVSDSQGDWPGREWWTNFGSPELAELMARAKSDNRDLAAAAARVLQARAQVTIQRSVLLPQINGQAQAQRAAVNGAQTNNSSSPATITNSFGLRAAASYQLDLWGMARADVRSARESLKSARFAQEALALTLTADVANAYFSVLTLRERTEIAKQDIEAINSLLEIIKLRVATGKSSHLDLAQEQAQIEAEEAQLPMLEEQELEARVALAVLLGQPPESFQVAMQSPDSIRSPIVGPGLVSDLLLRRPDIAEAEAKLASAHANLDAARAAFLPQFTLTGDSGYASTTFATLVRGPNFVWSAGAQLLQTIFDGGKLVGQKRLAAAVQAELIASYQGAILNAYADVESALGQVTTSRKSEEHLGREVAAAREAFDISQLQYRQGVVDLLTVLQAQQTFFAAKDQLAQTRLVRLQAIVHLYEALGGGWVEPAEDRTQFAVGRATTPGAAR